MNDQPAIPAATMVVVREPPAGPPELLMVERSAEMKFAGGALVFPGGRIDDGDHALAERMRLGSDGAARVAAIRETIEETAIPVGVAPLPSPDLACELQLRLARGSAFADLLDRFGLTLEAQRLVPFAHWIPKFHAVRRFDTLFFLAQAPEGRWVPKVNPGECERASWITADSALDRDRRGAAKLIFPTRRNLERLAQHGSFAEMAADAASHPVEPITPWVEEREGSRFITIPGHLGYPVTFERLEGLWRG